LAKFKAKLFKYVHVESSFFIHLFFMEHPGNRTTQTFEFSQPKMGSPFYLIFYTTDTAQAAQLANKTFMFVDSMVKISAII